MSTCIQESGKREDNMKFSSNWRDWLSRDSRSENGISFLCSPLGAALKIAGIFFNGVVVRSNTNGTQGALDFFDNSEKLDG
jgi:hypothetical protein